MGLLSKRARQPSNSMEEWFDVAALGLKLHFKGDVNFAEQWPDAVTGLQVRAGELWAAGGAAAVEAARDYGLYRLGKEVGRVSPDLESWFMEWTADVLSDFLQDLHVPRGGYFDLNFFEDWSSQIIAQTGLEGTYETHRVLIGRAMTAINVTAADEFAKFDQRHLGPKLQSIESPDDRANFLVAAVPSALPVLLSDLEKVRSIIIDHICRDGSL
jgi:hypothetical protein